MSGRYLKLALSATKLFIIGGDRDDLRQVLFKLPKGFGFSALSLFSTGSV